MWLPLMLLIIIQRVDLLSVIIIISLMWFWVDKQWGRVATSGSGVTTSTFTFPLKFTTAFTAVASSYSTTTDASIGSGFVNSLTNTTCKVVHERTSGYSIIAVGKG